MGPHPVIGRWMQPALAASNLERQFGVSKPTAHALVRDRIYLFKPYLKLFAS